MNGGNKITIEKLVVLWYLHGLGDKYATLRGTVMSSNVHLMKIISSIELMIRERMSEQA